MKTKLILTGALIAVVAIIYFSLLYPWPGGQDVQGTQGTNGGVKKYNSQQMSDKDVQLNEKSLSDGKQADPDLVLAFYNSGKVPFLVEL